MSHKKKLLDFLSAVPSAVTQHTSQTLTQVKNRTATAKLAELYATPAFASSDQEISEPQPSHPQESELPPPKDVNQEKGAHISEVPSVAELGNSRFVSEQRRNLNINSVMTERSQVDEPAEHPSGTAKKKTKLSAIEEQKLRIQQELKNIEAEIDQLKEPPKQGALQPTNTFKKHKEISQDTQAFNNAQKLMSKLHAQKKAHHEKREQQQRERLQQLEKQALEKDRSRQEQLDRIRNERRQQIARRIEEEQRRREERRMIDQQSNQLIKEIKKEEQTKLKPISTSLEMRELETKKKLLEKKRNFDMAEIEQHQLRYKQLKLQRSIHRSEEPHVSMSVPRYPKGKFLEQIEYEQHNKKQEERLREEEKRANVEKRLKYGELVKKIFLPPKPPKRIEEETASKIKPPTPDVVVNGTFKQEVVTRKTYTNSHDSIHKNILRQQLPELAKATGSSLSKQAPGGRGSTQLLSEAERQEKQKVDRERLDREKEIRRQTKERLKRAEELDKNRKHVELPKVEKYENYLGMLPKHKQNNSLEWKRILQNDSMSKEQKYKELMSKASLMENKAKFKQEMNGGGHQNQQAMNLIIGSIQAKLALLDKF